MNELQKQNQFIVRYSLVWAGFISVLALLLLDWKSAVGIWIGSVMGLFGYWMIVWLTSSLSVTNGTSKGRVGYMMRYASYALVLVTMTILNVPVLAMLAGFLTHKLSLLFYVFTERKDFHGRTS